MTRVRSLWRQDVAGADLGGGCVAHRYRQLFELLCQRLRAQPRYPRPSSFTQCRVSRTRPMISAASSPAGTRAMNS